VAFIRLAVGNAEGDNLFFSVRHEGDMGAFIANVNWQRRTARCIGFVVLILLALSQNAYAHSYLVSVEPPLGTVFDATPESIALIFTQGPDTGLSKFELQDESGELIRAFVPVYQGEDNSRVALRFGEPLADGLYRIAWLAVSTTDGHPTRGTVPLAIGVSPGQMAVDHSAHNEVGEPSPARMAVRWLIFLSLLILAGVLLFPLILPRQLDVDVRSEQPLLLGGLLLLLAGGGIDVWMQSVEIGASFYGVLFESQWGVLQFAKYGLALAIGVYVLSQVQGRGSRFVAQALAAAMLAAQAFAGHNANLGWLGTLADWAHIMAAALWLGGLAQLAWIWIPNGVNHADEQRLVLTRVLLFRFSQLAMVSVVLILITGVYTALQHVTSWDGLFSSLYGRALMAKVLLLLPVVALAGFNRFSLLPKLSQAGENARGLLLQLKRWITREVLVIAVIVFFAGVLTNVPPPHAPEDAHAASQSPLLLSRQIEDMTVEVQIHPLHEGQRVIQAQVLDAARRPLDTVLRVSFAFNYLDEDLGDTLFQIVAEKTPDAGYQLEGGYLSLPGRWEFNVIVRIRQRLQNLEVTFPVEVAPGGGVTLFGEHPDEEIPDES